MMERRSIIYIFTLFGLLLLALQSPYQLPVFVPFVLTVVPALLVRFWRFWHRRGLEEEKGSSTAPVTEARMALAEKQQQAARTTGWVGPGLLVAAFAAATGLSLWQRGRLAEAAAAELDAVHAAGNACTPEVGGPPSPAPINVLLLADTQLHELRGKPFPGQMEIANALVPVSRRPVELDMLSTATVVRFQTVYAELAARLGQQKPLWAHLGDLADLSCVDEMDRMTGLLGDFAKDQHLLAGIAPGNHDSTFQGNFDWSPYWSSACKKKRLDKPASDWWIEKLLGKELSKNGGTKPVTGRAPAAFWGEGPVARYTITGLGTLPEKAGQARGVLGIFVDTSDRAESDFGIAGAHGTFSDDQREEIVDAVNAYREDAKDHPGYGDPWYVVFSHVPYDELTGSSQHEMAKLIATLDAERGSCQASTEECHRARVIAMVSAHTHVAGSHRYCIGQRVVREIVVGSVIDPPQQAALLEVGLDPQGHASARISTLPTVAREGFVCPSMPAKAVDAGTCRDVVAKLSTDPACRELFRGGPSGAGTPNAPEGRTCAFLERKLLLTSELEGIARTGGPTDPDELLESEKRRAGALVRCLCRTAPHRPNAECDSVSADPLEDYAYGGLLKELAHDPDRQNELTCLSWAAADLQANKASGMTIGDALRCGFDDATLPPAQVTVAVAEDKPCY